MGEDEGVARREAIVPASRGAQPIDAEVGRRIRAFRRRAGLTQKALAQAIGVSFQQLQKYEGAINRASASRLAAIARCLDLPVEAFFDPSPPDSATQDARSSPALAGDQAADLLRAFFAIPDAQHRQAILALTRTLAREVEMEG